MIERLSELLGDKFKVLFIKKWTGESQTSGIDFTLKNGYFDLILTSPYIDVCKVTVQNYKVTHIEGKITISEITAINNALSEIRTTEIKEVLPNVI